jgi:DtxR family Mn-dependent transcriptional regulator
MRTHSEENYLKTIFNLSNQTQSKVSLKAISDMLGNNPASVIDMLKKLKLKDLIEYDKTSGAMLTKEGLKVALQIVRKHRLWEVFLKDKLGYNWAEVHDIAEQLEHIKYPDLADRLDKYLGFPEYDPHGDPIPKANGDLATSFKRTLSELKPGETCRVVAVKDTSGSFLEYLQSLNIEIGTLIENLEVIKFDNSITIKINNNGQATVSKLFSENILIQ